MEQETVSRLMKAEMEAKAQVDDAKKGALGGAPWGSLHTAAGTPYPANARFFSSSSYSFLLLPPLPFFLLAGRGGCCPVAGAAPPSAHSHPPPAPPPHPRPLGEREEEEEGEGRGGCRGREGKRKKGGGGDGRRGLAQDAGWEGAAPPNAHTASPCPRPSPEGEGDRMVGYRQSAEC